MIDTRLNWNWWRKMREQSKEQAGMYMDDETRREEVGYNILLARCKTVDG